VNEVSGTELDLTLTEMKAVSWVFEAVVQVNLYTCTVSATHAVD